MAPFKWILSSEIARLVYGYLAECGVTNDQLASSFLRESPYLAECRELHDMGRGFHTVFMGLNLKEILEEYSFIHHIVDSKIKSLEVSERSAFETGRLSDKLCMLFNFPDTPRSRTNSFVGSRPKLTLDRVPVVPNNPQEDLEVNDPLDSPRSFGVPETPGNSLVFDVIEKPTEEKVEKVVQKQPKMCRSKSVNDLSLSHDKRKSRPKFFTPNKCNTDEPPKEIIYKTLKDLYEDKELHEKIAQSINEVREAIPETTQPDMDEAIKTIIEKFDPSFNQIMEQTLNSFDLAEYLKPVPPPSTTKKNPKPKNGGKFKNDVPTLVLPVDPAVNITTVELQPYPEIRYDPADCNIVTGTLDSQGKVIFFSNPAKKVYLPPAPKTRLRNILPKMKPVDLHPVVICTPLMPPPSVTKVIDLSKNIPTSTEKNEQASLPSLTATPAPVEIEKPNSITPGRKSYIRALEFETPAKISTTEADDKPTWDTALRAQLSELEKTEKSLPKKGKREKKVKAKPATNEKKVRKIDTISPRVTRSRKITVSPSKNNLTAKRNTYAISHGSSSAFESSDDEPIVLSNLVEMTPAKEDVPNQEETPFTKLLRENVSSVDIDLNMIPTPAFPATPCIDTATTPLPATRNTDYSSGSSYYKPELTSPSSCFNDLQQSEQHVQDVLTNSGTNLVVSPDQINELVNEGKKILGLGSGKNMSFLKLQMIAKCDLKLSENIPIKENLRDELDRKRRNTLRKIKTSQIKKKKVVKKSSTPKKRLSGEMTDQVRLEIPPFVDNGEYPELNLVTKKKLFIIKEILKRKEVVEYLNEYSDEVPGKIKLVPCVRMLFKTLYKWLKHPHKHELDYAKKEIEANLEFFNKIHKGISYKKKSNLGCLYEEFKKSDDYDSDDGSSIDSTVVRKKWSSVKRKTDATLPLKKRKKQDVQQNGGDVAQAQKMLKTIDVDSFLSRVHGQEKN